MNIDQKWLYVKTIVNLFTTNTPIVHKRSIDLCCKPIEWFLYDENINQKWVMFVNNVMRCAIWYHLYNFKNMKNTHG